MIEIGEFPNESINEKYPKERIKIISGIIALRNKVLKQ
jgi:hypothetical protein